MWCWVFGEQFDRKSNGERRAGTGPSHGRSQCGERRSECVLRKKMDADTGNYMGQNQLQMREETGVGGSGQKSRIFKKKQGSV